MQAESVPHVIEFKLAALVERVRGDGPTVLPARALHSPRLLRPTRLTAANDHLRDLAAQIAAESAGEAPEDIAVRVSEAVSGAMTYSHGVTSVITTAAEALAAGRGVCQDYAHVMLALCRALNLPARYVSGHLLGQGGTHAWVEVIVPRGDHAEAVALDPCNRRRTDGGYLTIATGRDYRDVAPTSGWYYGDSAGRLTAARRVDELDAAVTRRGRVATVRAWTASGWFGLYSRNTLTLCPVNRDCWIATSCGEGSVPFTASAWKVQGVRLSAPTACSM